MIRFALLALLCIPQLQAIAEVETNGQLEPPKPFTLMVIRPELSTNQYARSPVNNWLARPQTQELAYWLSMATVREYSPDDPFMREHHQYVLSQMQSSDAIALVDDAGGCWCVLSGSTYPRSEMDLAQSLETHRAAVMQAAREAAQRGPAFRSMNANQLQQAKAGYLGPPQQSPQPWQPNNGGGWRPGGGLLNPQVDFSGGVNLQSGVEQQTRQTILIVVFAICFTILFAVFMHSRAITDDDN